MGLIEDFIAEHPKEMELAQMRRREVKKLLADYDKSLREQIAREIEAQHSRICQYQVQHFSEQGYNDFMPSKVETFDRCSHLKDAAIARGYGVSGDNACPCFGCQCEPNQVTKDAIEEARNQNDTR